MLVKGGPYRVIISYVSNTVLLWNYGVLSFIEDQSARVGNYESLVSILVLKMTNCAVPHAGWAGTEQHKVINQEMPYGQVVMVSKNNTRRWYFLCVNCFDTKSNTEKYELCYYGHTCCTCCHFKMYNAFLFTTLGMHMLTFVCITGPSWGDSTSDRWIKPVNVQ